MNHFSNDPRDYLFFKGSEISWLLFSQTTTWNQSCIHCTGGGVFYVDYFFREQWRANVRNVRVSWLRGRRLCFTWLFVNRGLVIIRCHRGRVTLFPFRVPLFSIPFEIYSNFHPRTSTPYNKLLTHLLRTFHVFPSNCHVGEDEVNLKYHISLLINLIKLILLTIAFPQNSTSIFLHVSYLSTSSI